jgi:hypothetical protein
MEKIYQIALAIRSNATCLTGGGNVAVLGLWDALLPLKPSQQHNTVESSTQSWRPSLYLIY